MLVRNIGAPRLVASPTHNHWTDEVLTGGTVEVPDDLGVSLCEQVDVWEPGDADAKKKVEAAVKAAERAARKAEKEEAADAVNDAPAAKDGE